MFMLICEDARLCLCLLPRQFFVETRGSINARGDGCYNVK
jgi:hypothetical protein